MKPVTQTIVVEETTTISFKVQLTPEAMADAMKTGGLDEVKHRAIELVEQPGPAAYVRTTGLRRVRVVTVPAMEMVSQTDIGSKKYARKT